VHKCRTLNAIGVWLGFLIFRICDTSLLNGPISPLDPLSLPYSDVRTVEAQLYRIDLDGHGGGLCCRLGVCFGVGCSWYRKFGLEGTPVLAISYCRSARRKMTGARNGKSKCMVAESRSSDVSILNRSLGCLGSLVNSARDSGSDCVLAAWTFGPGKHVRPRIYLFAKRANLRVLGRHKSQSRSQ